MADSRPDKSPMALTAIFILALLGSTTSQAGEDHDRARQALEAGEILPLRTILERVEREHPGQIMEVELERREEQGQVRWHYEIKQLRAGGALIKLRIDARDGTLLDIKSKHERGPRSAESR